MVTAEILSRYRWLFERSDGTVIATIEFEPDGSFVRTISSNERNWRLDGEGLAFLDAGGAVSTLFHDGDPENGQFVLEGDFVPLGSPKHHRLIAQEARHDEHALRRMLPEVLRFDDHQLWIRASARVVTAFAGLRIFFGRLPNRFAETDVLLVPRTACLEPYSCFPVGTHLYAMGAFSYSESAVSDLSVGRYCSIATGLEVFRDRHPVEWVSSSSMPYDADPVTGYRSFVQARRDFGLEDVPLVRPANGVAPPPRLEHDVWIGQNVQLARDITIGTGAVVAAGAVVTKDVAPYAIVGGIPARTLRQRFPDPVVSRLLRSEWWRHRPSRVGRPDWTDPVRFLDSLEIGGEPVLFEPPPIGAADLIAVLIENPDGGS